jgi:hypothetical protein
MANEHFYLKNSQLTHEKTCQLMPHDPPQTSNRQSTYKFCIKHAENFFGRFIFLLR